MLRFRDRSQAGRALAEALPEYRGRGDLLVLALPRGGVPVAFEVAMALDAPLDVFVVRKLGMPGHEELAIGAIATGGVRVLDEELIRTFRIEPETVDRITERERAELDRRERRYRGDRPPPVVAGHTVIIVDDGLATGATMRAAVAALRSEGPRSVVVASPVGARESCSALDALADDVVCLLTPEPFYAVGLWYEDFAQTTDDEVHDLLERAAARQIARR